MLINFLTSSNSLSDACARCYGIIIHSAKRKQTWSTWLTLMNGNLNVLIIIIGKRESVVRGERRWVEEVYDKLIETLISFPVFSQCFLRIRSDLNKSEIIKVSLAFWHQRFCLFNKFSPQTSCVFSGCLIDLKTTMGWNSFELHSREGRKRRIRWDLKSNSNSSLNGFRRILVSNYGHKL